MSEPSKSEPPYDWDPETERMFQQFRDMERPNPKPSWTFPSPFIAYSGAVPQSRGEISWGPPPRTLAELRMYGLSWAIRSKPEWQRKIFDPVIMDKWRKEALEQQEGLHINEKMTANMVNYVVTELAGYARLSDAESGIESGPFDAIWYSDRLISNEISDRLRAAVADLEDVPNELKDWHPGSDGQVLDLVHPSLCPIVYGRTRSGSTLVKPPESDASKRYANNALSSAFCWLPSDFSVDATDGSVTLVSSYINNLDPAKHKPLYRLIESVLTAFVPLFERVLSQINGQDQDLYRDVRPGSGRIMVERVFGTWSGYSNKYAGVSVPCVWDEEPEYIHGMTNEQYEKLREDAPKRLPEAYAEYTGELEKTIVPYSLRGRTIQCIVKLANIHLTPENPEYKGGSWHVEGMVNERIVASGIYYYEEENISESRLAFRVITSPPVYHQQDDNMCMDILYGMERNSPCCQDLGSITTSAGRALAWPNIYHHRVAPFSLVDSTKPGHRKILAIFLVDPSIDPIPSATTIPPQQADWAFSALEDARVDPGSAYSRIPPELSNAIHERFPDAFITRAEAEEYRLRLMKERTTFVKVHDRGWSHRFNMCEH
ncbi:hypothetical protein FB451DRAFT_1205882 [Mycena latifolia]|nr:hypothetical protein FB451DRAFT_1205882 [Mycena latifolia]